MKVRQRIILAGFGLAVMALVGPMGAQGAAQATASQATGCAEVNWPVLQPSDPAYPDAMELAKTLAEHGFIITCIAPSTMTGTFEGQKGAAVYRTNQGSFDALFLPKPQDFDELQIVGKQEAGRYQYSFGGSPKPWPANLIDASHPVYFIKHANRLIVADDKELAAHLGSALAGL